jgi:hypothetical protein
LPENAPPIGQTLRREEGVSVQVEYDHVVKRVEAHAANVRMDWLRELYGSVLPKVRSCIRIDASKSTIEEKAVLWLYPVGLSVQDERQRDVESVRAAMRCVLEALEDLHAEGWCHRDVRWGNVLEVDANQFILIDFEYAAPTGRVRSWQGRNPPPEIVSHQVDWTEKQDVFMAGKMLSGIALQCRRARALEDIMCAKDPACRPSAKEAMEHAFFHDGQ